MSEIEADSADHLAEFQAAERYEQLSELIRAGARALNGQASAAVAARIQQGGVLSLLNAAVALRDLHVRYAPNWRAAMVIDPNRRVLGGGDLAARRLRIFRLTSGNALLLAGRVLIYSGLEGSDPDAASVLQTLRGLTDYAGPLGEYARGPVPSFE
jgi:hypothetical protein